MTKNHAYPIILALLAAFLFGASAPIAKLLLGEVEPAMLAAFLYLGCGFGLFFVRLFQPSKGREAGIQKPDVKWLLGATLAGGVAAPIILLFSLRGTPAATASLLLNFEGVATTIIATIAFRESVGKKAWLAIFLITLASILLTVNSNMLWGVSIGALGIISACFLWGFDNNFTRNISSKDPISIVMMKGFAAGTISLLIAILAGNSFPSLGIVAGSMLLGCLCYGLSITLFILVMRGIGAARTSALFGSAPFAGALFSFVIFAEGISVMFLLSIILMAIGTMFLFGENHDHSHIHEAVNHEHSHSHEDGHHEHEHDHEGIKTQSHAHFHPFCEHSHRHLPDIHHRHAHQNSV